jgi:Ca2+ transporting ATPase
VSIDTQDLILAGCSLNSNSHLMKDDKTNEEKRVGNQTECSLLDFVNRSLVNLGRESDQSACDSYSQVKKRYKLLKMFPFNSDTKKMTVIVELEPEKRVRVFTKGASENLIDDCITMVDKDNKQTDLDLSKREKIKEDVLKKMA